LRALVGSCCLLPLNGFNMQLITEKNWKQILLLLAAGVLSGLIGAYIFSYSVSWYINSNNLLSTQFTEKYGASDRVVIQDAKNVVVEQDASVAEAVKSGSAYLVGFYKKTNNDAYDLSQTVGQGVILSADGWLLADNNKIVEPAEWRTLVAINSEGKVFQLDQAYKDKTSGYWLIKMVDARSLPVVSFASARVLEPGQIVVVVGWQKNPVISYYRGGEYKQIVRSSDLPARQLLLSNNVAGLFLVLNMAKQVVGVVDDKGIQSLDYYLPLIDNLSLDKANRAVLGVYYKDLSNIVTNKAPMIGVQLVKSDGNAAVQKGSVADRAGLKEGDIILSVDNVELNADNDLAELISIYKPKSKLYLKIKRDQTEKVVEIKLD